MGNSENIRNTATKIFVEGGNNADRIGGSSTVIFHQNEMGQTIRAMYDCGALFAPEGIGAEAFVADVLKYLSIDDDSLKKAFPYSNMAEINRIRTIYKAHGIATKKLDAMFITHMHEDHIGGLVHLLRAGIKFPKIYASEPTISMIQRLCSEGGITNIPEMQKIEPYQTIKINDSFEVSAIPVSHSTVGAYAFYTKTKYNGEEVGILNMGDYNLEKTPIGEGFNQEKFAKFMQGKPLNSVLVDSTSATLGSIVSQNPTTHEEAVENIVTILKKHPDKAIVSPIISRSTENLYNFLEAAKLAERKVFLDGYMLRHTYDILQRKGLLDTYKNIVYHAEDTVHADAKAYVSQVPTNKRIIMFSGAFAEGESIEGDISSFGKKISGFVKFVNGTHRDFSKEFLKDCVVVAAQRAIPVGSVPSRQRSMFAKAAKNGAIIIQTETDKEHSLGEYPMARLQRSGHANGQEMKTLIELCNAVRGNKDTKMFVCPVHGDAKQLLETSKVALHAGAEVYIPLNGDIIHLESDYIEAKKRQKDEGKNENIWIGFSSISNDFGEVVCYKMSYYTEKTNKQGKVVYVESQHIADIQAINGVKSKNFTLSNADRIARIEEMYEDLPNHEPLRNKNLRTKKSSRRGGR